LQAFRPLPDIVKAFTRRVAALGAPPPPHEPRAIDSLHQRGEGPSLPLPAPTERGGAPDPLAPQLHGRSSLVPSSSLALARRPRRGGRRGAPLPPATRHSHVGSRGRPGPPPSSARTL